MMDARRCASLLLIGMLALACPVAAGSITSEHIGVPYLALVAVDQTAVPIPINFGVSTKAMLLSLYVKSGSAVYCTTEGTAVAEGAPIDVGQIYVVDRLMKGPSVTTLSCVTAAAGAAVLHVIADNPVR